MNKSKKQISMIVALIAVVAVIAVSLFTSFGAWKNTGKKVAEENINANLSTAVDVLNNFEYDKTNMVYEFSNEIYQKAGVIGSVVTEKTTAEQLQFLANNLDIESVAVTDENGKIIASYPEDKNGTDFRDDKELAEFAKVYKGVSVKSYSTPVCIDEATGTYSVNASVVRSNGAGVVIISTTSTKYDDVLGKNVADGCNDNTIIAKGDDIVSSSFDTDKSTLSELGITEDKLNGEIFTITSNEKEYMFKAQNVNDFTVLCAVSAQGNAQAMSVFVTTLIADGIALVVIAILFVILGKSKKA